jgi:uncharacterized protein YjaG (DUF416 family)
VHTDYAQEVMTSLLPITRTIERRVAFKSGGQMEMSTRPYLLHIKKIDDSIRYLNAKQAFAFGTACAERQWPIYTQAYQGRMLDKESIFRESLDAVWGWLLDLQQAPREYAEQCENAIHDEDDNDATIGAFEVAHNIYRLIYSVENNWINESVQVAQSNMRFLDAFIYELLELPISSENDIRVDNHELMQREVRHQLDDLMILRQPLSSSTIQEVRNNSYGQSILGSYWYKD